MEATNERELNKLVGEIWWYIRDFYPRMYSLPKVTAFLVEHMGYLGYHAVITDDKHRDYKIIQIRDHHFRIVREKGWNSYDVRVVD